MAIELDQQLKRPLRSNPRLLEGGEPNPFHIWRNTSDYGYTCPRDEYVQSPACPTLTALSNKWKVGYGLLMQWKNSQGWDAIRDREWQRIARRAWELSKEAIAQVQARELQEQLHHWQQMRADLSAALRNGYVIEQSASGKVREVPLSIKDRKDAAQTLQLIDSEINRVLGMGKGLLRAGESEDEVATAKPVRRIRHNYSVEVTEYEQEKNALPEGRTLDAEAIVESVLEPEVAK